MSSMGMAAPKGKAEAEKVEKVDQVRRTLNNIDKFLSEEHMDKLCFLCEGVLTRRLKGADDLFDLQIALETLGKNNSFIILKRFFKTIGYVKFSKDFDELIDPKLPTYTFPSYDRLYLFELAMLVSDNLGAVSFKRLKNRIPDCQLGGNRDRLKTSIQLFRRLIEEQTLCMATKEAESMKLLNEWLSDIGRKDIAQLVKDHERPRQEQGGMETSYGTGTVHPSVEETSPTDS